MIRPSIKGWPDTFVRTNASSGPRKFDLNAYIDGIKNCFENFEICQISLSVCAHKVTRPICFTWSPQRHRDAEGEELNREGAKAAKIQIEEIGLVATHRRWGDVCA